MKAITSPLTTVKKSPIHGRGIFAKTDIPKGTRVIEYVGEKITKTESDRRADIVEAAAKKDKTKGEVYIYELNKKFDIDGNVSWNTARLINHSCDPNCESDVIKGKVWIIATCTIKKGEEINYNYNYDLEHYKESHCKCGSKNCIGYIVAEEEWPKLRRMLKKQAQNI